MVDTLRKEINNITGSATRAGPKSSENRYRRLFETARDGILILNAVTLKITDVNPFMMELLGYSRDEFMGKELWEIGLFADKEASQQAFQELQAKGYLRYEDLPLQTKDGKLREVEFVSNVYEEDTHQVIQCNIRDISERKRAEEERRLLLESVKAARAAADTANDMKDEFLATVSHELRTPLTSILGWSNLLTTGNLDEQESKRALETIERNALVQRRLIDDLLDLSRIITGKLRLNTRLVDLGQTIEVVIEGLRPAADSRNIHLETALDRELGPISGDPDRLQQIIWNLLSNAIKFTPKGGSVAVRLGPIESHVEIKITDTGQGIEPLLLPHIFDRFRQSDSSNTRRHGGLGLGLSIVRELVQLHGGTVSVESSGVGRGTTFKVILPVRSVHHESGNNAVPIFETHTSTDQQLSLNGLRILVVDDQADARELVATVLRGRGAGVVSVESGEAALDEMKRQRFEVLLADIGLPVMDGYAFIQKVRALPVKDGGKIPAAALTAYAGPEDRMRVLSAGYQIHIAKPVEPAELTTVVANLAGRYGRPVSRAFSQSFPL